MTNPYYQIQTYWVMLIIKVKCVGVFFVGRTAACESFSLSCQTVTESMLLSSLFKKKIYGTCATMTNGHNQEMIAIKCLIFQQLWQVSIFPFYLQHKYQWRLSSAMIMEESSTIPLPGIPAGFSPAPIQGQQMGIFKLPHIRAWAVKYTWGGGGGWGGGWTGQTELQEGIKELLGAGDRVAAAAVGMRGWGW